MGEGKQLFTTHVYGRFGPHRTPPEVEMAARCWPEMMAVRFAPLRRERRRAAIGGAP